MLLNRKRLAQLFAELMGTFLLTFSILSVSKSAIGIPYFVAIGAGLTLAVLVLTISTTSGAHVNPAVSLGLWSIRKVSTVRAVSYIVVQFMGAAFAWKFYTYLTNNAIPNIAGKNFDWRIFAAEAVGTLVFTFGIAAAMYQKYEGGKLAATIGGSLIVGILLASVVSNGLLNPAVALGVQSWSKEYIIAPFVGALVGFNLYAYLFAGESFSVPAPKRAVVTTKIKSTPVKKKTAKTKKKK